MEFKAHQCESDNCPCFECSACNKRLVLRCKIKHHQNTSDCRLLLTPEQKARDLLGRLWVPPCDSDCVGEREIEASDPDQAGAEGSDVSGNLQPPVTSKLVNIA